MSNLKTCINCKYEHCNCNCKTCGAFDKTISECKCWSYLFGDDEYCKSYKKKGENNENNENKV